MTTSAPATVPTTMMGGGSRGETLAPPRAWRHRFACLNVLAIWTLLVFGANVTSHDAGLAVPDWPTSLGFMNWIVIYFLGMVRDLVAYEHNHRVAGLVVGLLVMTQAVWLWRTAERRHQSVMGLLLLIAVSVQGVLGGLTVRMKLPAAVSVMHGVLAQSILCFSIAIAYVLSREWRAAGAGSPDAAPRSADSRPLRRAAFLATVAVWLQLLLGAIVRHTSAKARIAQFADLPVLVHMTFAALVVVAVGALVARAVLEDDRRLRRPAFVAGALVLLQLALGVLAVVKSSDPAATVLHVMNGATLLAVTFFLLLRSFRLAPRSAA